MNNTTKLNNKVVNKLNKLELPDYTERYKRLESIGSKTGRSKHTSDIWEAFTENWSTDLLLLKL